MKKNELESKIKEYSRKLSPTDKEQELISKVYNSIDELLQRKCLQIGSYPRYTSVTPVHDLDILYIIGLWSDIEHNPSSALQDLYNRLKLKYENPTNYSIKISLQTHSVTISFLNGGEEILSVDIVPAYIYSKNNFDDDMYKVPEILKKKPGQPRKDFYQEINMEGRNMEWIKSDPRGYIKVASLLDEQTKGEFRKSVKFVKKWKYLLSEEDEELKLKSFHVEQVITRYFLSNPSYTIFDVVFLFFTELPNILNNPNTIQDRANSDKYIDDYLKDFTEDEKKKITEARDGFLVKLEEMDESDSIEGLLQILFYKRSSREKFLFDSDIPAFIDNTICINGWIQKDGRDFRRLNGQGYIDSGNKIRFEVFMGITCDIYKWKVKNDERCIQPRGEITDHHTYNPIEETKYKGNHFVEVYAISNNACIARARQNVIILK